MQQVKDILFKQFMCGLESADIRIPYINLNVELSFLQETVDSVDREVIKQLIKTKLEIAIANKVVEGLVRDIKPDIFEKLREDKQMRSLLSEVVTDFFKD